MNALDRIAIAGSKGGWILALGVSLVAVFFVVTAGAKVADVTPLSDDKTENVLPASGIEGLDGVETEAFCRDDDTTVRGSIVPGVGFSYELLREKDAVVELITVTVNEGEPVPGKHYYNTALGQDNEPAIFDADGLRCLLDRGELKL